MTMTLSSPPTDALARRSSTAAGRCRRLLTRSSRPLGRSGPERSRDDQGELILYHRIAGVQNDGPDPAVGRIITRAAWDAQPVLRPRLTRAKETVLAAAFLTTISALSGCSAAAPPPQPRPAGA